MSTYSFLSTTTWYGKAFELWLLICVHRMMITLWAGLTVVCRNYWFTWQGALVLVHMTQEKLGLSDSDESWKVEEVIIVSSTLITLITFKPTSHHHQLSLVLAEQKQLVAEQSNCRLPCLDAERDGRRSTVTARRQLCENTLVWSPLVTTQSRSG